MKYVKIEGSRKLSAFIEPMKAVLSDQPAFDSPEWLFEIKWDGYRAGAEIDKKEINSTPVTALLLTKPILKFSIP